MFMHKKTLLTDSSIIYLNFSATKLTSRNLQKIACERDQISHTSKYLSQNARI